VPTNATVINAMFGNDNGTWDNNNYSIAISPDSGPPPLSGGSTPTPTPTPASTPTPTPAPASCVAGSVTASPCPIIAGQQVTITYAGNLAASATSLTMHWGYNNWNGITDTAMTKQGNGSWVATITLPQGATSLNMAFYNQSNTWDNNNSSNYNLYL
jgi:hypothetical protein